MWHRLIDSESARNTVLDETGGDADGHSRKCKCSDCQDVVLYTGFRRITSRVVLFYVVSVLTLGLPFIICWLKKDLFHRLTCRRVEPHQLVDGDIVVVLEKYREILSVANVNVVSIDENVYTFVTSRAHQWSVEQHTSSPSLVRQSRNVPTYSWSSCSDAEEDRLVSPATTAAGMSSPTRRSNSSTRYSSTDNVPRNIRLDFVYFDHEHLRYFYNTEIGAFCLLTGLEEKLVPSQLRDLCHCQPSSFACGTDMADPTARSDQLLPIYGPNELKIDRPSRFQLLVRETLNPFYIFQLGAIILWSLDDYWHYAMCILFISLVSITVSLSESERQLDNLEKMIQAHGHGKVTVLDSTPSSLVGHDGDCGNDSRQWKFKSIDSTDLAPGHILRIPDEGCTMLCDAVLIYGSCIVSEAMLTGESMAVVKTAIPDREGDPDKGLPFAGRLYSPTRDSQHTLFTGTTVLQTRFYDGMGVLAVVVRTGFNSTKGSLIRSIMHPRPVDFHFYRDAVKFVLFLFAIACLGMAYSFRLYLVRGAGWEAVILRCLDIVTIVVPPALPAVMTVGTYYSQSRLSKASIYCLCPSRINICGQIDVVCLDKTGTITEDGLEFEGVALPSEQMPSIFSGHVLRSISEVLDIGPDAVRHHVVHCLASCHSLSLVNGVLVGDPLEINMFQVSGWHLRDSSRSAPSPDGGLTSASSRGSQSHDELVNVIVEPPQQERTVGADKQSVSSDGHSLSRPIGILKWFDFDADLARMSVITRRLGDTQFVLYTKGAPERIRNLCLSHTVPTNFESTLDSLTSVGFRVLALACRPLPADMSLLRLSRLKRPDMECQLHFLGLLVMKNHLKAASRESMTALRSAGMRCVMVTGDNVLTALSVGRHTNMIDDETQVIQMSWMTDKKARGSTQHNEEVIDEVIGVDQCLSLCRLGPRPSNPACSLMPPNGDVESAEVAHVRPYGMESKLAMVTTGFDWEHLLSAIDADLYGRRRQYVHILHLLLDHGTVFARMSPEQKAQLVRFLQERPFCDQPGRLTQSSGGDLSLCPPVGAKKSNIVAMCGDGANDCSALKAAHVGVSLADSEASVAAPFTSRIADISCLVRLSLEGRCALVTSFTTFKYMALYSFIQFISVMLLYTLHSNFGDLQYLYIDLFVLSSLAVAMGSTKPATKLSKDRPASSLLATETLVSICVQILLVISIQVGSYLYLWRQDWFSPLSLVVADPDEEIIVCWENTALFFITVFQYISLAVVFSEGKPYRKPFYTNIQLVTALSILVVATLYICLAPDTFVANDWLELMPDLRMDFRFAILSLSLFHLAIAWTVEWTVVRWKVCQRLKSKLAIKRRKQPKRMWQSATLNCGPDMAAAPCPPVTSSQL